MYLPTQKAVRLVKAALTPRTAAARMKAAAKVLQVRDRIAVHPDLAWDDFLARYLRDCLETGQYTQALVFLDRPVFSANQMKALLEPVVSLYLHLGLLPRALEWIETVSYVFGQRAVLALAKQPGFEPLSKSKRFHRFAGPDAALNFYKTHLAESTRAWKRGDIDDIKDALIDARDLCREAKPHGATHVSAAKKHLAGVLKAADDMVRLEPAVRAYVKGL